MRFLGIDIFQTVINFFQTIREGITLDYFLYIFIGLELLTVLIFVFIVHNVYELKLLRAIDKINAYLYEVKYINESNLIEFNNMMKRVPKTLRYHWQQYMLNRDKKPSHYMSVENCIDRPLKSSHFASNISIVKKLGIIYAILSLVFTFGWASGLGSLNTEFFITVFAIPLLILIINYFFVLILNIKKAGATNELYQTFHIFNRFIDKAVSTMPNYVDFEVLFTEKEISRGIPVLNEYIEKRQLQEQEEMKRARENAIQQELYNFEEAGEKGELVLERAMKETEIFVNMKNRLNVEIDTFEKEIDSLKRNFDNTSKDYQKKLQASKENSQRLREQQEATTNRIENNYIRKQQADEIKKQQQIEKEFDDAQLRFNQEINSLADEIKKRKEELEEARVNVEKSMLAEYQTFSNKIYAEIRDSINEKVKLEREELINARQEVDVELEKAVAKIDSLEMQNKVLVARANEREAYVRAELFKEKNEIKKLLEEKDKIIEEKEKQIELISSNYDKKHEKGKAKIKAPELLIEEQVETEFTGAYDENGNYVFKDGSFYDNNGNFHDVNGNVFTKDGVVINKVEEEKPVEDVVLNQIEKEPELVEETVVEYPIINESDFFFDDKEVLDLTTEEKAENFEEGVLPQQVEEIVEEAPVVQEPAKKRGRPKKAVEETPIETSEPKRRGRPKKVVEEATVETAEPKRRGRPRKVEAVVEEKPARKPGRPKKVVNEEVKQEPKRRGRPKKVVEETPVETTEPKRRGRPRKVQPEAEEKPLRKPGRPKKVVDENEAKTEPKKRGRPKKEESLDENLRLIEERLKEQNELLKRQQKALDRTVKKATKNKK